MTTRQLIFLIFVFVGLVVFVLQNGATVLPLVLLGQPSPPLPVGIWVVGAIAAGAITTGLILGLPVPFNRSNRWSHRTHRSESTRRVQDPSDRRSSQDATSRDWNPDTRSNDRSSGYRSTSSPSGGDRRRAMGSDWESRQVWNWESWDHWGDSEPARRRSYEDSESDRRSYTSDPRRDPYPPPVVDAEVVSANYGKDREVRYTDDYPDDYADNYAEDYPEDDYEVVSDWRDYDDRRYEAYGVPDEDDRLDPDPEPEAWEDWREEPAGDRPGERYPDDAALSNPADSDATDPELEDWENWEGYERYFQPDDPAEKVSQPAIYEVRRDPTHSSKAGTLYSFSYRNADDEEGDRPESAPANSQSPQSTTAEEPSTTPQQPESDRVIIPPAPPEFNSGLDARLDSELDSSNRESGDRVIIPPLRSPETDTNSADHPAEPSDRPPSEDLPR